MIIFFQIAGGLLFLLIGGEILVRGSVSLAKGLGISPFVIGLTVVAYGTSSPELVVSIKAALEGYPDIALGNVIGSNLSNILSVLGLTALIYPITIDKKLSTIDGVFMVACTILLYLLCTTKILGLLAGIIFLVTLGLYTWLTFKTAKKQKDLAPTQQTEEIEQQIKVKLNVGQAVLACVAGIALLILGGDILIRGAVPLAKIVGLSEAAIGVTLIAFGSSAPELAISLVAAYRKHSSIVFGNIIGSNLFNILGVLGVTGIFSPVTVAEKFLIYDLLILLAVTIALFYVIYSSPKISRLTGGIFLSGYVVYIFSQLLM